MNVPDPPQVAPWALVQPHLGHSFAFFLDRAGATSFAGSQPSSLFLIDGAGLAREWREGAWQKGRGQRTDDPIAALADYVEREAVERPGGDSFDANTAVPRTVGYLSYELGSWIEPTVPRRRAGDRPLAVLASYDRVDVWRPGSDRPQSVRLHDGAPPPSPAPALAPATIPPPSRIEDYRRGFDRIAAAIAAGEIYQANLARRLRFDDAPAGAELYRALRRTQPVPEGALLDYGGFAVLSNSPECFLDVVAGRVRTEPIKGTSARAGDLRDDARKAGALVSNPKEQAEHVMIVDLERNDLGRVCETGSVRVTRTARTETYTTLHHLVSQVSGRLRGRVGVEELLRATFPGGSITGAPKVRAMRVIGECEDRARGVYCGAIGTFNGMESVHLSVAIRTATVAGKACEYWSGGGLVADSTYEGELAETELKAQAFAAALAEAATPSSDRRPEPRPKRARLAGVPS